jgi:hypothetical protein
MKTLIQTDKRIVTQIVKDIDPKNTEDMEQLMSYLYNNKIPFKGILIECNSNVAYIWNNKKNLPNITA